MKYYLVGIKGSGMAGLAIILKNLSNEVCGCDINQYLFTQRLLENNNIKIESFDNMNYKDYDVIVVGNAYVNKYNFADKKVVFYQEMLSIINDKYYSIAVCGTHGKTTTSNMIKHVLSKYDDVSYLIGDGQGKAYKNGKYFVYEACEHRNHFLSYHPNIVVCLNIDYDHVEFFNNKTQYKNSFITFFNQAKDCVIINDSISVKSDKVYSFGLKGCNVKAFNVKCTSEGTLFSLNIDNTTYRDIFLPFYGKHMLIDALACISCCYKLNYSVKDIIDALKTYKNAARRYNLILVNSCVIIDDYGHHPNEIKATIQAIKQEFKDKELYIIYHPDRPKRLVSFLKGYQSAFKQAKETYVLPFINDNSEEKNALSKIINNTNIFMFNDSFYKTYEKSVFLFTGSKEMKKQIQKLIYYLN